MVRVHLLCLKERQTHSQRAEIDELILNQNTGGAAGYTYGSSLFVSKPAPAAASQPYGYGAYGSAGLFANHDVTGRCTLNSQCTAAQCTAGECNAGPMCCPTSVYGATDIDMSKVAGYPPALTGNSLGGSLAGVPQSRIPPFGSSANTAALGYDATKFHNYKLVWTPKWLAWMVDNLVMRNESVSNGRQAIPWRPVTLRPLIRTNNGSAPILCGTPLNSNAAYPANPLICVPAGGIFSTSDGGMIANNTITNVGTKVATVKALPAQVTAASLEVAMSYVNTATSFWSYPSNCIPCNLLNTASTAGAALTLVEKTLYNAEITFWADSSVYVRRTKYTPYSEAAIAAAVTQANSWGSTTKFPTNVNGANQGVSYLVETVGGACGSTITKPAPTTIDSTPGPTVAPVTKPDMAGPAPVPSPPPPAGSPEVVLTASMTSTVAMTDYPRATPPGVGTFSATKSGSLNGYPVDWSKVSRAVVNTAHSGQCQYIEDSFEDAFNDDDLNTTRWLPVGSVSSPPPGIATASSNNKYATTWGPQEFGGYQVRTMAGELPAR